jgi:prefoldin subunit 5
MGVLQSIFNGDGQQERHARIPEKTAERVLGFLQENNISTLPALRRKVLEMYNQLDDVRGSMKYIERRVNTLDEHIRQAGYYQEHRELYAQYQQIKRPKKQAAFKEKNYTGIALYEAAKRYLDANLNGHSLPLKIWKEEREKLAAQRGSLNREYRLLKEEVTEVETIRRTVENIIRDDKRRSAPQRDRDRGQER